MKSTPEHYPLPDLSEQELGAYIKGADLGYAWGRIARLEIEKTDFFVEAFRVSQDSYRYQRKLLAAEQDADLAFRDHKTGVLNSRGLELAYNELAGRRRKSEASSILFVDLDHFRDINAQLGHGGADQVLKNVADIFVGEFRDTDIIGRHGGDEFVIILPDTPKDDAIEKAKNVRAEVSSISRFRNKSGSLIVPTVTIGVDELDPGLTFEEAYKKADELMLQAKESGIRNDVLWEEKARELFKAQG